MFQGNIEKLTKENDNFRKVIYTGKESQLVLMTLHPGEEIGEEVHPNTDQILFLVEGVGQAILNDQSFEFKEKDVVFVTAGTKHNFINSGDKPLKLYTIYAPAEHKPGTIHATKADAELGEEDHN